MSPAGVEMSLPEDEELVVDHDAKYFHSNGVYLNPELQPTGEEDGEDSISPEEPQYIFLFFCGLQLIIVIQDPAKRRCEDICRRKLGPPDAEKAGRCKRHDQWHG